MPASAGSSYEEVPYEGFALFLTHPNHLAAVARLFGVSAAEIETCRVLELGCARGDNLIPMAYSLPEARFVGIDLSPRQIAEGQAAIAELGLRNIALRQEDILELGPELGAFDFIVAHGVYSWVPDPVREKMLRLCAETLAPNGLAHISYNIYPGWHMRSIARDMMLFRSRQVDGTLPRVRAGKALMQGLAQVLAHHDKPYARCLREEAEKILRHEECYLAHEFFEEWNDPIYFHEFVERAAAYGLRYLAEAEYWTMAGPQSSELFDPFEGFADDWLGREQLYDFINGRAFRHAVLCREGLPCSRRASARALRSLRITSLVRPAAESAAPSADGGEEFHKLGGGHALSTNDPAVKLALRILDEDRPRSVSFEALWARVEERLAALSEGAVPDGRDRATVGDDPSMPPPSPERLAESLLDAYGHNVIELHVSEPEFTVEIGDFPRASPVARRTAATSARVANLRHRMIGLVDFDQLILTHLDGLHDRRALLGIMLGEAKAGTFSLQIQGRPISDPAELESILGQLLDQSLERLAANALLVG
jgi:methyltransferase-like protein/cyclopropane fatty-acyl-phospholipid synthase-like methyltransferase